MEKLGASCTVDGMVKWCVCYSKQHDNLSRLVLGLVSDSATPLPRTCTEELERWSKGYIYIPTLIATLFTTGKCGSNHETYTQKCYTFTRMTYSL